MKLDSLPGILVVGAGHGIGLGLVRVLLEDYQASQVIATYRDETKASELMSLSQEYPERLKVQRLDPLSENELKVFSQKMKESGFKIRLLLNACGYLHDEKFTPEKRLRSFSTEYFFKCLQVNTLITPLILGAFEENIERAEETMISILSAKVGSIEDNKMGGWYSYRASKAALNMLVKTAAIEYQRTHKKLTLISMHPGTTKTSLSEPFLGGTKYQVHLPVESARNILNVLAKRSPEDSGKFFSWNGEELPY